MTNPAPLAEADPEALLAPALALVRQGRLAAAEPALRAVLACCPDRAEPHLSLGQILGIRGEVAAARMHFETALRLLPSESPEAGLALTGLAGLAEDAGDLAEAARLVDAARALDPAETELHAWAARLAWRRGQPEQALEDAERAIAGNPGAVDAARIAARALLHLHGPDGASRAAAERGARDPFSIAWLLVAAGVHAARGEIDAAIAELRAADALDPESPGVQAELGLALAAAGQHAAAEQALRRALAARPTDLALRNRLATVLWKAHRFAEASSLLRAAIADLGPDPVPLMNLALIANLEGRQDEALATADQAVALTGGGRDALMTRLCVLPYHPACDAAALRGAAEDLARSFPAPAPVVRASANDPARPLRIGLLSGNLCCHPVGWLTIAGAEALAIEGFELAGYSLRRRDDPVNRRFRAACTLWREMGAADAAGLAGVVAADGVDILLDMGGYGEGGCPAALARRLAPVQVKWVGSQFGTTGLPAMDWMLTDRWETPAGFERFYTERLLRLPDGYVCYAPPADAPPVAPLPAATRGHVTFGCFNNIAKVTRPVLAAWARILATVPDARLVLRTHALGDAEIRAGLRARLHASGIDPARVEMHGSTPHRDLLAAYGAIDIALDPFPYAGGLTVCEALWMGVPVVSLHGDGFAARHGLSHLSNVGLGDWSVDGVDRYVALAAARAADLPALAALRAGLRDRVAASPLCDAPRFGRGLGAALRHAWQERG